MGIAESLSSGHKIKEAGAAKVLAKLFYMGYEVLVDDGHFLAFHHFLTVSRNRGVHSLKRNNLRNYAAASIAILQLSIVACE